MNGTPKKKNFKLGGLRINNFFLNLFMIYGKRNTQLAEKININ